jgi:hypothetical protein
MEVHRPKPVAAILVTLLIAGTICVVQQMQLRRIKGNQSHLAAQHRELSTNYAALLATAEAGEAEILRLRNETSEILILRNQLAHLRRQPAAAATENKVSNEAKSTDDCAGYVTKEQLRFAGFDSPENALQSAWWARMGGDYTNWLASLGPQLQEEELANPTSREDFWRDSASAGGFRGMQVMATKPMPDDRMELKVRFDTEHTVTVLIIPMVALGNEWRLGGDFHAYTEAWERHGDAQ